MRVDALQWDGTEERLAELVGWIGQFFTLDDAAAFALLGATDVRDRKAAGYTAMVYDESHSAWLGVRTGDWLIKGLQGEFYPCAADDFETIYERVRPIYLPS